MKTLGKILLLLAATVYLGFTLIRFIGRDSDSVCSGMSVTVRTAGEDVAALIDSGYVHELMVRHKFFPEGQLVADVPLARIDSVLAANPYIKEALVYIDATNRLCIEVTPHTPVMHIIPEGEAAFYIGADGEAMPAEAYVADLPLVSGYVSRQFAATRLGTLARIMSDDGFWDDQIGQIFVSRDSMITIVPRVGDFVVHLGRPRDLRGKLARLKAFYTDALPQVGWNVYGELNLEYDNQIIATRKRIK